MAPELKGLMNNLLVMAEQKEKLMMEICQVSEKLLQVQLPGEEATRFLDIRQDYMDQIDKLDDQIKILKEKMILALAVQDWQDVANLEPQKASLIESSLLNSAKWAKNARILTEKAREKAAKDLVLLRKDVHRLHSSLAGTSAYQKKPMQSSGYYIDHKK